MDIDQRLPDLSDKELENLHANAVRLAQSGSQQQRLRAEGLLPLLGAEMEARRRARTEASKERRRASVKRNCAADEALKEQFK